MDCDQRTVVFLKAKVRYVPILYIPNPDELFPFYYFLFRCVYFPFPYRIDPDRGTSGSCAFGRRGAHNVKVIVTSCSGVSFGV
jgi:hypothetical protein